MGIGKGLSRRALFSALVAGVVMAFAVPAIALAATASFTAKVPASGSSSTNTKPTISVVVYDRYGVRYMRNMLMSIDGVRVTPTWTQLSTARSFSRFRLAYSQPTALSAGSHTVKVYVKDRRGNVSRTSWSFTVVSSDAIPPVTTSNAQAEYFTSATILLFPTDSGSGVAHTYYKLDGGAQITGTAAFTSALGPHTLEFWSVDNEGNVETHHVVDFALLGGSSFAHAAPENSCTAIVGCHGGLDTATIHWAVKCTPCHAPGVAATNDCLSSACHGPNGPHTGAHAVIPSSGTPACTQADCHGTDVVIIHTAGCGECHASTNATVVAAIAAGGATCETCHAAGTGVLFPSHTAPAAHVLGGGACFGSTACHAYTDAAAFHMGTPSGCSACHTGNVAATVAATVGWANRCALVGCHPNLDATHDEVFALFSAANASSHGAGVRTMFDGSQGITLKDTEEDTVTTAWDFPEVNVFWSSTDASAPASAIKGLTKNSVVTCFDCHSGDVDWFTGPHGASARWAIDANYPYPFKYAILGGPAGAVSVTNPYRQPGTAPDSAATPATSTAGIPASASGIKARIAANLGTTTTPIYSTNPANLMITNYQNYEDFGGGRYIADATSGQYAVICAKCHDLYNWASLPTTNAVDQGWGNAGPDSYEGMHGAHAGGTARNGNDVGRIDGRSDCASCHVAVPHGWSQPRLLVNGYTGPYLLKGGYTAQPGYEPTVTVNSVADPFPYYQGRGMPLAAGIGVMAPAPATSPGNGPNDAKDDHAFNAYGKPVWEEAACISCSGSTTGVGWAGLEHRGYTSEPAKLK